ncbi:unnamed protein product [Lactuca saligna]|uniref:Kinesin-like protein KIN-10A n=1 Tax=Lactuca saligna TaxID=75948 RepID=A0AA35ZDJ3_LACSI|nr:unnamed protein product [Lactuca saligna]
MAPTPSSKSNQTHIRTPQSKHRLNFNPTKPSSNPTSGVKEAHQHVDHPVEVIGRIRDYPDRKDKPISILKVNSDGHSVRVRTEVGYRDFTLDGASLSEDQNLEGFYKKFVQPRINGVKLGDKCTIMMYGPTGSGKSHTMFGCAKQQGIVYKSLRDILGDEQIDEQKVGVCTFVQVSVLEIYNEEIYDLLSTNNNGGFSIGWSKGNASKVKLEVMGKKAKNATFISGTEAGKISKEIQKVEKRRIIKSTFCNERSSRSHCMIILDVPTVGGRLMLVDMAGSENIEQAGQTGFEAKMQTAKINQGNTALKRVVESIANGDSHVPFRDSKLTMLLQDSFEDDKSKILMILCASPDPKEIHKTISTLEYGAKAKCIVRGGLHTPIKTEDSSTVVIAAMDQFIHKLQMENKAQEKEKIEAHKQLMKKEEEIAALRAKLSEAEEKKAEEEVIKERTHMLRSELEKKIEECQKMADRVVEMERRKMEEKIFQQQEELEMLRHRLEEIESELTRSRDNKKDDKNMNFSSSTEIQGSSFTKRLLDMHADEDPGMEKSMDLDKSFDMEHVHVHKTTNTSSIQAIFMENTNNEEYVYVEDSTIKPFLSTVFEEDEEEREEEEVQKEVIEEKIRAFNFDIDSESGGEDTTSSRHLRIQNIFPLCGNYTEISPFSTTNKRGLFDSKENCSPVSLKDTGDVVEVVVKWEEDDKVITTLRLVKDATVADLRKLIQFYIAADNQAFSFLALEDPVEKEEETWALANKLPTCNNGEHLACLRPSKKLNSNHISLENNLPFSSLENKLPFSSLSSDSFSPQLPASPQF